MKQSKSVFRQKNNSTGKGIVKIAKGTEHFTPDKKQSAPGKVQSVQCMKHHDRGIKYIGQGIVYFTRDKKQNAPGV
ncbi:MAG: hypothetical protein HC906_14650 [Bacteroidales bacterium]|nr:hypothetical protein [Bacteroidales bacterium]